MSAWTLAATLLFGVQTAPVILERTFKPGERLEYEVRSHLISEVRTFQLRTAIPEEVDLIYRFNLEVQSLKPDGSAVVLYKRPQLKIIEGETFDSPPKEIVQKLGWQLQMTISPINEILNLVDHTPKPTVKSQVPLRAQAGFGWEMAAFCMQFVDDVRRLSLYAGSLDSALDFTPKLPLDEVEPGDTWHRTVSYQPRVSGNRDKPIVQRLDTQYRYLGTETVGGRSIRKIEAKIELETDLAEYIHSFPELDKELTGLQKAPLSFHSTVLFELDAKTNRTLSAKAENRGSFSLWLEGLRGDSAYSETFRGRASMSLVKGP